MSYYQDGYEYYVLKCEQFGLKPINFVNFVQNLSEEQLDQFNEHAQEVKNMCDLNVVY